MVSLASARLSLAQLSPSLFMFNFSSTSEIMALNILKVVKFQIKDTSIFMNSGSCEEIFHNVQLGLMPKFKL